MVRFINDSRQVDRTSKRPLLVIGAGVPRAATSSMQAAFEELGYDPCLHMANIIPHIDRMRTLHQAIVEQDTERRQKLLHQLIDGHVAICDLPVIFFTPDLMDMYPDAKIVLNGRPNAQVWAESAAESFAYFFTRAFGVIGFWIPTQHVWYKIINESNKWCFARYNRSTPFYADLYDAYYRDVREEAAKRGRPVLEFKAEDGWEPLAKFLGKPVPDKPFPKVNEKAVFKIVTRIFIAQGVASWLAVGGCVWAGYAFRQNIVGAATSLMAKLPFFQK